jgi:hypothetical protein
MVVWEKLSLYCTALISEKGLEEKAQDNLTPPITKEQVMSMNLVKHWFPQFPMALERAPMAGLLCAAALLLVVTLAWTHTVTARNRHSASFEANVINSVFAAPQFSPDSNKTDRLGDGVQMRDQSGYFRISGDRMTFVTTDNQRSLIGLENTLLERITKMTVNNPDKLEWIVSGTVTEYRGRQYLLVSQARLKSQNRLPIPDK